MNYLKEINRFYDWLETNSVPKSVIALWHALMHINNKTGWAKEFNVAISVLELKTGFKSSELFKARNILQDKKRIFWEKRGGNLSATYKIIPFCLHEMDANENLNGDTKTYPKSRQMDTIIKLEETRSNKLIEEDSNIDFEFVVPSDNVERNVNGLVNFLKKEVSVSKAEGEKIIIRSNYGEKNTAVWKAIKKIRENKGIKSKEIMNPVNYILKYLE